MYDSLNQEIHLLVWEAVGADSQPARRILNSSEFICLGDNGQDADLDFGGMWLPRRGCLCRIG